MSAQIINLDAYRRQHGRALYIGGFRPVYDASVAWGEVITAAALLGVAVLIAASPLAYVWWAL